MVQEKKDDRNVGECSGISDTEGSDSNALYCICRQKQDKRFMICCDSCQEWFHGDCVGISATQGRKMERKGQEYMCPPCTMKKQIQLQPDPQPEPEMSFPECLSLSPPCDEQQGHEELQDLKETVLVVEEVEEDAPVMTAKPEPEAEMETGGSLPLCIGPECSKQALPDSVYCGTDCILQHAAFTMKTLSVPKVPKLRGRPQRKAATARPTATGQRSARMSKRLAVKSEEREEEDVKEDDGGQEEAASPLACDPSLTEAQATSIPSSKFYTASTKDSKWVEANIEAATPSKQPPGDTSADAAPSSPPATEPAPPQSHPQEKAKEPISSGVPKLQSAESLPSKPPNPAKTSLSPAPQSPSTSAPRHHETGALMVTKTTYVIPKKQPGPQPPSSHVSASTSGQKPSFAPTLLNETRNLLVPPAPSAPSSRPPSQPNNQVRQSIQRSLTSILFKRVCDCEDLEMSESDVAKLVASIEMEMFDIFRNTDSKYMNKYRTIMFNLKDPKNKGLLYRVVRGEISPFRLARMSQKDMQAIKASEPTAKETTEVKNVAAKATSLLQKPEAVKVDLPCLNPVRPARSTLASQELKKSLPSPAFKTRASQPSQCSAVPDILACMLKDTTSEHKAHLFDLKCKICTGQILAGEEEEPAKKKPKTSETKDKYEPSWRKCAGDDSPLRAPPDSPDMDSPTFLMDNSSRLIIDVPALTIVESPASPVMDSPASPALESPASPVMESPASPTPDTPKTTSRKRSYTPVVIPAVSTVTITRRDPRTAASRFSASYSGASGPSNTTPNLSVSYAPLKETICASPSPPVSSRPPTETTVISESPADGETSQFLAKHEIVWKGFLNMLSVAKFVTKGFLVSGTSENLKADLPDTIQIGGRILPQTVWDYVAKLKTSVTKELCVIRFHPATEEEEVAYVSLFSYFSSRGRYGVVANGSRSIKDVYLVPLSAKESIPSILQPLDGPGFEKNRPNLLLGLAVIQKTKRPGSLPQEIEEKRPKVHMSKDPMWIPKPPVLYGSDKLEIFQPYDPETPASTTPPGSPPCPESPSDSCSSGSVTIPSCFSSIRTNPPVSTSAAVAATKSTSNSISDKNPTTASSNKTPLQKILKSLFGNKQTDSGVSSDGRSKTTTVRVEKVPVFSQVSGSMVDPIVQQYGQKSKVKKIVEEEEQQNDFDRPYDPEEEYDPAMGYGVVAPQNMEKMKADGPAISGFVDDDVAYDPEDETIFADMQSDIVVTKPPVPTPTSDPPSCPTPISTQIVTPTPTSTPVQSSSQLE
ncbi:death-inducer obliterator 1 [Cottoperca gobio]|uniref:Death-inducer obliterator 1 n=1 Tax=Cottoperca gobio TaxID=56716 RepID=A0A6J2Q2D6_COTGO|nr:death-inducer obliterator 1 [Cottoperca gobio]